MPIYIRDKINIHEGENKFTLDTVKVKGKIESININPTNETSEDSSINTFIHDGSSDNQTTYSITFEEDTLCDILIVGGGGGGDRQIGGGGGGGAVLYARQVTIPANNYTIKVGKGGNQNEKGYSTEAFSAICLGGGTTPYGSWSSASHGNTGGSGGGGSPNGGSGGGVGTSTIGTFLTNNVKDSSYINLYNGYAGGNAGTQISLGGGNPVLSGGGGGAGESGNNGSLSARYTNNSSYTNWVSGGSPGKGGDGVLVNITGHDYYWGAGGGGGSYQTLAGTGGKGGGGAGGQYNNEGTQQGGGDAINIGQNGGETATAYGGNAGAHTGSGGGGGGWNSTQGGKGGSGIVIIKSYIKKTYTRTIKEYFNYTGSYVTWNVPKNVNEITAYVWGAGGGGMGYGSRSRTSIGGTGGFVKAKIDVSNINSLNLIVAGGGVGSTATGSIRAGGYLNGGDSTATNYQLAGSGGGLAGIFKNDSNFTITNGELNVDAYPFIIAGSGGGAGDNGSSGTAGAGNGGGGGSGVNFINGRKGGDRKQNNSFLANTGGDDGTNSTFKFSGGDGVYAGGSGAGFYGGVYDTDDENIGLPGGGGGSSYWGGGNVKYIGDIPGINGSITQPDYSELVSFSIDSNIAVGASTSTLNAGHGLIILEYDDNHIVESVYKSQTDVTEYTELDCDSTNLVAHYKFDGDLLDSSGNENHITSVSGTIDYHTNIKQIGQSSLISGNEYVEISSLNALTAVWSGAFTISFWMYPTTSSKDYLVGGWDNSGSANPRGGWYLRASSGYLAWLVLVNNSFITLLTTDDPVTSNNWYHVAISSTGNTFNLSLNGVIKSIIHSGPLSIPSTTLANRHIGIGRAKRWGGSGYDYDNFGAYFDDFRIYDKVLSRTEINYLANNMIVEPEYTALTFRYDSDYIIDKQAKAEKVTGVNGWILVRHLPSGTSQYYSGNDNFNGTFKLNEITKKNEEEWSTGYDNNNNEILFIRGDFTEWLRINRNDTLLTNTWIDRASIATNYGTGTSYRYFNDGRTSAPWFYSQATYTETKILFHEDVNSGGHSSGLNGDSFDMFVRNTYSDYTSSQLNYTLTFNQPAICDILIVGGGGASGATGSSYEPGGGGGGGIVYMENKELYGTYNIYVGNGGENGKPGYDSKITNNNNLVVFDNILLIGYGGGNGDTYNNLSYGDPSATGGSGGGGSHANVGKSGMQGNTFWDGTQYVSGGNDGGPQNPSGYTGNNGSGGGGAGAAATGRDGGIGRQVNITGALLYYGGGGAGGGGGGTGSGGLGGGGDASSTSGVAGKPGEPHTGGGGGAPYGAPGNNTRSQPGGSGIVIIRYKTITSEINYDAQWIYNNAISSVYFYGNVGIGNNANNYKLNIDGDISISGEYYKKNNTISLNNWQTNGTDIYRENGNVGIDNPNPVYKLQVNGDIYAAQGGVTGDGSTTWSVNSDRRIKDNIEIASYKECYENLKKMNLFKFNYKEGYNTSQDINQLGFIAQEIETQYPKSINTYNNIKRLNVSQINYNLFGAMKYLINEIEELKTLTNTNTSNISIEPNT